MGILLPFLLANPTAFAKAKGGEMPAGFEKGKKKGWDESHVPPGWSKGKKKGWKEAGLPPGLEKKKGGDPPATA